MNETQGTGINDDDEPREVQLSTITNRLTIKRKMFGPLALWTVKDVETDRVYMAPKATDAMLMAIDDIVSWN